MHGLETIKVLNDLELEKNKETVSKIYLGTKENGKYLHFQRYYKKWY